MHTVKVLAAGSLLLLLCLEAGRWYGGADHLASSVKLFIALWLLCSLANMAIGVLHAGYTVMEELPIFFAIFSLPALLALGIWWKFHS